MTMENWLQAIFLSSILALVFTIYACILYFSRNNDYWKKRGIPYLKPKPIFGNVFHVLVGKRYLGEFLRNLYEKYSQPLFGMFFLDQPCLLVNDRDLARKILIKDFNHFQDHSMALNLHGDPISRNVPFFSKAPEWKDLRKISSPLFSTPKLKMQTDNNMSLLCEIMISEIKKEIRLKGSVLNGKNIFVKYALDSITSSFYGTENDSFTNEKSLFHGLTKKIMNSNATWAMRKMMFMFVAPKIYQLMNMTYVNNSCTKIFRSVTWQLIKLREETDEQKENVNDLIDILVKTKNESHITENSKDADILTGSLCQLFVAGYEGTSNTIGFALFELAKNPECQIIARKEAIRVKEEFGEYSYSSLESMKYLTNCIYEAIRMYPLQAFLERRCTEDYKVSGTDLVIEKGIPVYIPIWGIHFDPKFYSNPQQFNPNRYSDKSSKDKEDPEILTFGLGPRFCIGRRFAVTNAVIAVANILLNFEVRIPEGCTGNIEITTHSSLLQSKHGFKLKFNEVDA